MCKSKKIIALFLGLVMTISFSGCGEGNQLLTDTGSGKQEEIPIEDYLKVDVLNQEEQTIESLYTVLTLEKGTFQEEALKQILRQSYINVPTVRFSLEGFEARFGEYKVDYMWYVDKGDTLATVYTEVDEIAINEARVELQRLEERYQVAEAQVTEDLKAITDEKWSTGNTFQQQIMDIRYRQRQQDWEYEKYNYQNQITDAKEKLQELTQVGSVYEVTAPEAGYVVFSRRHSAGAELQSGDYICHIMTSSEIYTTLTEQADQFHYGMKVNFDNLNGMTPAEVVSGGSTLLYGNLETTGIIFRLDFETAMDKLDRNGLNNLILKGNLKEMENVILIPKKAVIVEDEEYFVTVLKEDGSLLKTEFIPGGSNLENYWVLDGLTEGMKIVYK